MILGTICLLLFLCFMLFGLVWIFTDSKLFTLLFIVCAISLPIIYFLDLKVNCYTQTAEIAATVIDKEKILKSNTSVVGNVLVSHPYTVYRLYFEDDIYSDTSKNVYDSTDIGDRIYLYRTITYRKSYTQEDDRITEVTYRVKTQMISKD